MSLIDPYPQSRNERRGALESQYLPLSLGRTTGPLVIQYNVSEGGASLQVHPLLTGGMIPTSSPTCITTPSSYFGAPSDAILPSLSRSKSTYSKLMVTAQLLRTLAVMLGYRDSSVENSDRSGRGAGRSSEDLLVYVEAAAK